MRVVLLAAGFATRLHPLSLDRAKPLLEVGGKPILSHILERVLALDGLSGIVLVTNARFAAQFGAWRDREAIPLPTTVVNDGATEDANKLGALADLALALEHVPAAEDVLVIAGDNLIELDLAPHVAHLRARRAPVLVRRTVVGTVPPRRYGELEVDAKDRITAFREKPAAPRSSLVSTGIYLFPPGLRAWLAEYLAGGGNPDAPGHFLAWLVERTSVYALPFEGRWFDVGTPDTLARARAAFDSDSDADSDTAQ